MRRHRSARVLVGTAILLAAATSGTTMAMAAGPAAPAEPGPAAPGPVGGPPPIQPLTEAQQAAVTKCLRDAGVTFPAPGTDQVLGLPPADGPVPPGAVVGSGGVPHLELKGGPVFKEGPVIGGEPGSAEGPVIFGRSASARAPQIAGEPGPVRAPVFVGESGSAEGPVFVEKPDSTEEQVFVGESGSGDGPAPGRPDIPGLPDAPDPEFVSALTECAEAAGLPGIAVETRSADGAVTTVLAVRTARP